MAKNERLSAIIGSAVAALGYELLGYEYISQGRHSLLRVYIDSPEGIKLEDCEKVSHQISAVLDVDDPIANQYSLEVSSPGLDRPLFTLAHFSQFLGHEVKLRTRVPMGNQRNFRGVIAGVEGETIVLQIGDKNQEIAFANVDKANLVPALK